MSTPKEETNFFKGKTPRNVIVGLGTIVAICVASLGFYTMSRQQAKQAAAAQDAKSGKTNFAKADQDDNHDPLDSEITDQELKARRDAQQYQRSPGRNPTKPSLDDSEPGAMNQFQQGGVGTSQSGQDGIDQVYTAGIHRPGGSQINQQRANSLDTPLDDMSPDKLEARNAAAAGSNGLTAHGDRRCGCTNCRSRIYFQCQKSGSSWRGFLDSILRWAGKVLHPGTAEPYTRVHD
jgi:hypothetical protein